MYGQTVNVGMQRQSRLKHSMTRSTNDLFDIRDTSQKLKSEYDALHLNAPSINSNAIARFRFMKSMNQLEELKKWILYPLEPFVTYNKHTIKHERIEIHKLT